MKIIRIDTCLDCLYYSGRLSRSYGILEFCRKADKKFDKSPMEYPGIPDWCPLEDAESLKEVTCEKR